MRFADCLHAVRIPLTLITQGFHVQLTDASGTGIEAQVLAVDVYGLRVLSVQTSVQDCCPASGIAGSQSTYMVASDDSAASPRKLNKSCLAVASDAEVEGEFGPTLAVATGLPSQ